MAPVLFYTRRPKKTLDKPACLSYNNSRAPKEGAIPKGYLNKRPWRNWQTRTFEGRMGNHPGSSPGGRTRKKALAKASAFFNEVAPAGLMKE